MSCAKQMKEPGTLLVNFKPTRTASVIDSESLKKADAIVHSIPIKRCSSIATVSVLASVDERENAEVIKDSKSSGRERASGARRSRASLTSKGFYRHFVVHDYHDYSEELPTKRDVEQLEQTTNGKGNCPFPVMLHRLLEDAEQKGFGHIISWQPHGRAFRLHDPKAFVSDILPNYSKCSKLSSFQRQLSLYCFSRLVGAGPDRGAYYHEMFLSGKSFLCTRIQRTRVKGTWVRTSSSPETEPNFNLMNPVHLSQIRFLEAEAILKSNQLRTVPDSCEVGHKVNCLAKCKIKQLPLKDNYTEKASRTKAGTLLPPRKLTSSSQPPKVNSSSGQLELIQDLNSYYCFARTIPPLVGEDDDLESVLVGIDTDMEFDADAIFPL